MAKQYAPQRGDLVWLQFSPQAGHEQRRLRPGLVVSATVYNERTGMALVCPVTNQVKGYPFEILLPAGLKVTGAVLADHVKNLDWKARHAKKIAAAPKSVLDQVLARIASLLQLE